MKKCRFQIAKLDEILRIVTVSLFDEDLQRWGHLKMLSLSLMKNLRLQGRLSTQMSASILFEVNPSIAFKPWTTYHPEFPKNVTYDT